MPRKRYVVCSGTNTVRNRTSAHNYCTNHRAGVDCPPSSNVQTATILLSIFKDTAQEPNVRLHSLHALIRNRYGEFNLSVGVWVIDNESGIGIVEQEISGAGLNQDVRYCLRHNHSTNSTAGIFLDIASHRESV